MSPSSPPTPPPAASAQRGRLLIVSTPIGNLGDVSPRLRAAIEEADLLACEDTRHSGRLLAHLGIKKRMLSMHDHNEKRRLPQLVAALEQGLVVAILSDAGTPLISDPGFLLVREAASRGLRIESIPGPSAILAALVVSALPPHPFTFLGFPPAKGVKRRRSFFRRFKELPHTLIFFESPHRILTCLADALSELGDRPAALCRELTKLHEEVLRGPLSEIHANLAARAAIKGELVVVVGRAEL